ncbi:placenta growth factor isoform X11 [Canis lupus familiaris]|uniref:placenta growth factor isoform X11 n=1 Tax=Canis lupus familiaris TaxID=9615 RepID=UPI0015F19552|nr:placenta growth factor isoform X11 [Canis lupus familiaris]XP_038447379.1 placenta growth factor isoform X11 [Canis lupus familiaris]XP_038530145.1 placenta growth factor isoform X11 [Canis lupus familiaris]
MAHQRWKWCPSSKCGDAATAGHWRSWWTSCRSTRMRWSTCSTHPASPCCAVVAAAETKTCTVCRWRRPMSPCRHPTLLSPKLLMIHSTGRPSYVELTFSQHIRCQCRPPLEDMKLERRRPKGRGKRKREKQRPTDCHLCGHTVPQR